MSVGTLRHFYVALWALQPLDWLRTVTGMDPAEYEDRTDPARQALNELVRKEPEAAVARGLVESTARRVVADLFPDRRVLRDAMRPFATPEARDISDDAYTKVRDEALRRARLAAAGCSLAEYLDIVDLAAMFMPYTGLIDLFDVLPDAPDMNYDVALAVLIAARLAHDASDGPTLEPTPPWELTTRNYLGQLYVAMVARSIEIPTRLELGVRLATRALQGDQGGPEWRVTSLPLLWDVAQQVATGREMMMASLVKFRRWALDQNETQWLARHLAGVMEANSGRGAWSRDSEEMAASSFGIVAEVFGAMGLAAGSGVHKEPVANASLAGIPQASRRSATRGSESERRDARRVIEVEFTAGTPRPDVIVDYTTWPYARASFEEIEKRTGTPAEEAQATLDAGLQIRNDLFRFWLRPVHNEVVAKVSAGPSATRRLPPDGLL